MMRGCTA
ncbi:hypothetical protein Pint_18230 [Pistacia integerrima]|nr:hypothetical protein Pint_18230 [Pistacia integerrima]